MNTIMRSAKDRILEALSDGKPRAIHEFLLYGISENSIGSRLPELAAQGKVQSRTRTGTSFKEWTLAAPKEEPTVIPERW